MDEKIYVVVMNGARQIRWFSSLDTAKSYIGEYGRGKVCRVYEYSLSGEKKLEKEPLYKPLW